MKQFEQQSLSVDCQDERLLLHPGKVMYWPREQILFAADVHVGKEHTFGRHGIAMPGGISEATLDRLFTLVKISEAKQLVVLGDFMHAAPQRSETWLGHLSNLLSEYRQTDVLIVAGNHDKKAGQKLIDDRIQWHRHKLTHPPFVFRHEPGKDEEGYVLSGHLHPAWRLGKARRSVVRTPIFWFREHWAVMPAFGEFTGGALVDADPVEDRIYITAPDSVIELPKPKHDRKAR